MPEVDNHRCIVCGGVYDAKLYRLVAVDALDGESTELAVEWAHIECLFKLLEKAENRNARQND